MPAEPGSKVGAPWMDVAQLVMIATSSLVRSALDLLAIGIS